MDKNIFGGINMRNTIILGLVLIMSISIATAASEKFDYLSFIEKDYIGSCGPNTKCKICFDNKITNQIICAEGNVNLGEKVDVYPELFCDDSDCNLDFHITDGETKTKDYSSKVLNFQTFEKKKVNETIVTGYNYETVLKNRTVRVVEVIDEANNITQIKYIQEEYEETMPTPIYGEAEIEKFAGITKKTLNTITKHFTYQEYAWWNGTLYNETFENDNYINLSQSTGKRLNNGQLYWYQSNSTPELLFGDYFVNRPQTTNTLVGWTNITGSECSVYSITVNDDGTLNVTGGTSANYARCPTVYSSFIFNLTDKGNTIKFNWRAFPFTDGWFNIIVGNGTTIEEAQGQKPNWGFKFELGIGGGSANSNLISYQEGTGTTQGNVASHGDLTDSIFEFFMNTTHVALYKNQVVWMPLNDYTINPLPKDLRIFLSNAPSNNGKRYHLFNNITIYEGFPPNNISYKNSTLVSKKFNSSTTIDSAKLTCNVTHQGDGTELTGCRMKTADNAWESCVLGSWLDLIDGNGITYAVDINTTNTDSTAEIGWCTLGISEGAGGGSDATEAQGDDAIERAINSSLTSPGKYSSQQIYARSVGNSQDLGKFDWFVMQTSPVRRWAINYVTANDPTSGFTNMFNVTPVFRVLELEGMTEAEITNSVGLMLNETK